MAVSRLSIVKFLELALACACVAIHYHSYNSDPDIGMLVTGTFVGYLIIFAGAAAGYMMQTVTHKRVDIFYSLVGVALYVASGAIIIDRYQNAGSSNIRDKNLAKASLAIINGALLLIDAVLTQRGG
ncbi:hypothetical protein JYU34_012378 [Plutella xylostella]|uniref:DUF7775 domain-containing protein n=1 Tax=Plutella xylostella TaxID=51655 RepID=A0ABQ7QB77_PLUXY|nr:uncharacterized protein LOC105395781 [Plutella xylostella]KAG7302470.1 hypothetical protein JYU34_012378 [Plutella xylostella]